MQTTNTLDNGFDVVFIFLLDADYSSDLKKIDSPSDIEFTRLYLHHFEATCTVTAFWIWWKQHLQC